jgi:hypothetical protein
MAHQRKEPAMAMHWTKTPNGRKRMAEIAKQRHAAGSLGKAVTKKKAGRSTVLNNKPVPESVARQRRNKPPIGEQVLDALLAAGYNEAAAFISGFLFGKK